jgi:hypothetical protein
MTIALLFLISISGALSITPHKIEGGAVQLFPEALVGKVFSKSVSGHEKTERE